MDSACCLLLCSGHHSSVSSNLCASFKGVLFPCRTFLPVRRHHYHHHRHLFHLLLLSPSLHLFLLPSSSPSHLPFPSLLASASLSSLPLLSPLSPFSFYLLLTPPLLPTSSWGTSKPALLSPGLSWAGEARWIWGRAVLFQCVGVSPAGSPTSPPNKQRAWPQDYPVWGPPLRTHSHRLLLLPFCPLVLISAIAQLQSAPARNPQLISCPWRPKTWPIRTQTVNPHPLPYSPSFPTCWAER